MALRKYNQDSSTPNPQSEVGISHFTLQRTKDQGREGACSTELFLELRPFTRVRTPRVRKKDQEEMCRNASSSHLWLVKSLKLFTVFYFSIYFSRFSSDHVEVFFSMFKNLFYGLIKNSSSLTSASLFSQSCYTVLLNI